MNYESVANLLVAGKYRIDKLLGQGGMSLVVRAVEVETGDRFAIKLVDSRISSSETLRDRFMNEARSVARLRGPHVARFVEVGALPDGLLYLVMELLEGTDLGTLLDENVCGIGCEYAVEYVLQACEAIAEAHAHGIVHRDIKPANMFLAKRTPPPTAGSDPMQATIVKVLDFGISRAPTDQMSRRLTTEDTVFGTPMYMSPEQMRSARLVDPRSDIWSLGAVLYELIEGQTPFEAETYAELCIRIAVDPPMPMETPVPPGLARAIARCLSKDPDGRFQNVGELARAIVPYARDLQQGWMRVTRIERFVEPLTQEAISIRPPVAARGIATVRSARAKTPQTIIKKAT